MAKTRPGKRDLEVYTIRGTNKVVRGRTVGLRLDDACYVSERKILDGISFVVPSGKSVAIVGTSGSGKSTILRMIFRFFDTNSGTVRVDGQDIRNVTLESLRKYIGVVPQDTVLFNDTIFHNIHYGRLSSTPEEEQMKNYKPLQDERCGSSWNKFEASHLISLNIFIYVWQDTFFLCMIYE